MSCFSENPGSQGRQLGQCLALSLVGQFYSLSWLGLARGSALAGDTTKASKAFQDFFELWKDADDDIPILQQAKRKDARLR
jgi:hypothetical protein